MVPYQVYLRSLSPRSIDLNPDHLLSIILPVSTLSSSNLSMPCHACRCLVFIHLFIIVLRKLHFHLADQSYDYNRWPAEVSVRHHAFSTHALRSQYLHAPRSSNLSFWPSLFAILASRHLLTLKLRKGCRNGPAMITTCSFIRCNCFAHAVNPISVAAISTGRRQPSRRVSVTHGQSHLQKYTLD